MKRLLTLREGKKEKEKEKRNVHTKEIVLWLKKIHHHFQLCREISASSNPSKRRWQCRAEDKRREKERSFLCFPLLSFPSLPLPSQAPCRVQGEEEGKALHRWVIPSPNPANRSADKQNQEMREKEHPPSPPPPLPQFSLWFCSEQSNIDLLCLYATNGSDSKGKNSVKRLITLAKISRMSTAHLGSLADSCPTITMQLKYHHILGGFPDGFCIQWSERSLPLTPSTALAWTSVVPISHWFFKSVCLY